MKPVYRAVPDEKNGYLQFLLLAESVGKPRLWMVMKRNPSKSRSRDEGGWREKPYSNKFP